MGAMENDSELSAHTFEFDDQRSVSTRLYSSRRILRQNVGLDCDGREILAGRSVKWLLEKLRAWGQRNHPRPVVVPPVVIIPESVGVLTRSWSQRGEGDGIR